MNARARLWLIPGFVLVGLFAAAPDAHADLSKKVIKTFKGQLIVSTESVETGGSDKEVIAAFKAAKLKSLKGEANDEDVQAWTFHYTAFLKKTGFTTMTLEFHSDGNYVADQRLEGINPKDPVLEGDISISENDGPARGKKYTIKLVGTKGRKETVLSTATLVME